MSFHHHLFIWVVASGLALSPLVPVSAAESVVELKVFAGGPSQRPDLLKGLLNEFEALNPGIRVSIGIGGATSDHQRRYLTTLFNGRDQTYDAVLIDVVATPQFAAAGWIVPLSPYFHGEEESAFADFLPVYRQINRHEGQWVAIPFDTSALFLFYRTDLLEKYGLAVPKTWTELANAAERILAGEKNPALRGLSFQGAPIEGTVATFLLPYWSAGGSFTDAAGRLTLDEPKAVAALAVWLELIRRGIAPANSAEVKTGDTLNEFAAGQAIFALNWGFAWDHFENHRGSRVKGRFSLALPPAVAGGTQVTTLGGYQWALSAYSRHKEETARLLRFLTSSAVSKRLILLGYSLPSRTSLYADAEVLGARPWLRLVEPVVRQAVPRPVTPRYAEVSETLRRTTSAVLGGAVDERDGVHEIQRRLGRVLR